jgi:tetratricopeptide (TPR) repeat protein
MQYLMKNRMLGALVVGLLVGVLTVHAGEAPPVPEATLDKKQQEQLSQLEDQLRKALGDGAFTKAVEAAREIAALRERWQGEKYAESVAARGAVKWYEGLVRLSEKDQQEVARSFGAESEADALTNRQQYQAAEEKHRQALAIRRQVLGEEHPFTATSYNNLAMSLKAQGRYPEAEEGFRKALAIRRKVQGEEHPLTAQSYNNLANNLDDQGKHAQAQRLHEKALAIKRQALGEQHPSTATSYNNLAANLNAQGKYAAAEEGYRKALAIRRKVLGEEHPDTAISYGNVALNLHTQGRFQEAEEGYRKALAIHRTVLGEEHPHTATSYHNLAALRLAQGRYKEAEEGFRKALDITRKVLGEEHPDTATNYNNLAYNLNAQGRYLEAEEGFRKALDIRRKVLGEEHPLTASSYNNLAMSLNAQGRYPEAEEGLRKALAIFRKVLGEEHPETAHSYNNVAFNLDAQGRHHEAEQGFRKALDICRKVLGEEHSVTASSYNNLAMSLNAQGRYLEAEEGLGKALAIRRKVLGEEHPLTAHSYGNKATNLHAQGRYQEAEEGYRKALDIQRKVLGEEHPDTAISYGTVAYTLNAQGRYQEAEEGYRKALAINRTLLGEEHPHTARSYNDLAANLLQQNKINEAVRLLQASLPGQEAARFHTASSGFDRAVAARQLSPHALLALGLAQLQQPAEAYRHAEASLARGLLDDLRADSADTAGQAASLRTHLEQLDRQLLPLFGRGDLAAAQQSLRNELLRQRRDTLSRLVRTAAEISARQVLPLADIQKQLGTDAALVLWLDTHEVGEHRACVVRCQGAPAWVRLPGTGKDQAWTAEDRDLAERLYRLLQQPTHRATERQRLREALRQQRLDPLRPQLEARDGLPAVRQLLVVPTGWAGLVPLEVLSRDYRISYVPSGSVYARLRQQHRPVEGSSLLALGDPVFTAPAVRQPEPPAQGLLLNFIQPGGNAGRAGLRSGDVLLQMGGTPLTSIADLKKALTEGGAVRYWREGREQSVKVPAGALGVRVDNRPAPQAVTAWRSTEASPVTRGPDPVTLPGTRWEVQTLSRLVPKTTTLLGSDASEQRLDELARHGQLKTFRLLHLATHGVVDWQTPRRSRLELSRDRLPDPKDTTPGKKRYTGELTVGDIRQDWKLDADLVVLSACQTALGPDRRGDGLLGFAQAFLQCGARCLVLSRWAAEDTATALLMLRFYENLLGKRKDLDKPLGRAEALEEAKHWLRELSRQDAEALAAALQGGKLSDTLTRGSVVELNPKERPVKLPEGERPYAHPFYWATFVLVGDPD